jgi:adenosylcobinamide kinase/adenosylcobinamide-phosphate guanylyltransferase
MTKTLILGGARSGKSGFAQRAAEAAARAAGRRPVLIATGQAFDAEMRERIDRHRADRGAAWTTREVPLLLASEIAGLDAAEIVVVDCLTLWLTNLMMAEADVEAAVLELERSLTSSSARIWLISNEVGMGIVPENALARRFRDEAGRLHQRLAAICDHVTLIAAGLPLSFK